MRNKKEKIRRDYFPFEVNSPEDLNDLGKEIMKNKKDKVKKIG